MVLDKCGIKIELTKAEMEQIHAEVEAERANAPKIGDLVIACNKSQIRIGRIVRFDSDGEARSSFDGSYTSLGYRDSGKKSSLSDNPIFRKATESEAKWIREVYPDMGF